jgi:hypothetical protein|tara:strand:+ start:559 stop:762 length:204 start_codon:yes stop_codon:yes gene_type:complete
MFVITQNLTICNEKNFSSFDILTDPQGQVMTFDSEQDAVSFLYSIGFNNSFNEDFLEEGVIKVDRLH